MKSPPLNSNDLQTNYFSAHSERYHPDGKTKDGDPPLDLEQRKHLQSTSTTEDRPSELESHWQDLEETGDEGGQKLALGRAKPRRRSDFPKPADEEIVEELFVSRPKYPAKDDQKVIGS